MVSGAKKLLGWALNRPTVFAATAALLAPVAYHAAFAPSAHAGAAPTKQAAQPLRRTPAIYEDPSGHNKQVTLLEFGELGLRMVGMASFNNKVSVFIQQPGLPDQMIYEVGAVIGGFKIIDIQPEYTVFEKSGTNVWLALGAPADEDEGVDVESEEDLSFAEVEHKRRPTGVKNRTNAYDTAEIVDELPGSKAASRPSPRRSRDSETTVLASAAPGGRFMLPMEGRVTSRFGYRKSPVGGGRTYHNGVDLAAPARSRILSSAAGRVIKVSRSWAKGLNVLIQHANGFSTAYFHLSKVEVDEGEVVRQGQLIGLEGSSGQSTGPHLHFEIHKDGVAVDPALYLSELSRR